MSDTTDIRYLGWSNIIIESASGSLVFDPFFREMYGAKWAKIEDYKDVKVICITHGHHEHYLDTPDIVKYTNAKVVGSNEVCEHLKSKYKVPEENLIPIQPMEEITVEGFKITAFTWYHRKISYLKFFQGNLITGLTFGLTNLLKVPTDAPFQGFFVETPEGLRLLNFAEGMNSLMPTEEMKELGDKFKPSVLVGGMQLSYEEDVGRAAQYTSPETFILYHPHTKLFDSMKIKSSPVEAFVSSVEEKAPQVKILLPEPMSSVTVANK